MFTVDADKFPSLYPQIYCAAFEDIRIFFKSVQCFKEAQKLTS